MNGLHRISLFEILVRPGVALIKEFLLIWWLLSSLTVVVHEYGGGSFIVVDESVFYITKNGIFRQQSAESEPEVIIAGDESTRFANLCYHKVRLVIWKISMPA